MATTRTPGITVLADGRRFIDKRYLGIRIGLRVGAVTQEQAEERLQIEIARVQCDLARQADQYDEQQRLAGSAARSRIAVSSRPRSSSFVRVSFARSRRFRGGSRSTARPCQSFDGRSLCECRCWLPTETSEFAARPQRYTDAVTHRGQPTRTCGQKVPHCPTAKKGGLGFPRQVLECCRVCTDRWIRCSTTVPQQVGGPGFRCQVF